MHFNERELAQLSNGSCEFDGILNHRSPHSGNFSQSIFKERYFKLKLNLLFYFRIKAGISDVGKEPVGVIILENSNIQYEEKANIPFAFSITFGNDPDRKHLFSGRTDGVIQEWVAALKQASYGHWRSQLILLQTRISHRTGKDPLLSVPHNHGLVRDIPSTSPRSIAKFVGEKASTFRSHLNTATMADQNKPPEQNLIDF